MNETLKLNRLEFMILETLYDGECKDQYHGMTITEIMQENGGSLGARMTVWKKMIKLVKSGYICKGVLDNHADTYFLLEKSIKMINTLKEEDR